MTLKYIIKLIKVTIDTPERILKKLGRFDVTFTCQLYVYIDNDEIELNTVLYNDYLVSKPIYRVVGGREFNS